jgi:maltose O-acetyltransferase
MTATSWRDRLRGALATIRPDLRRAPRDFWVNSVGGAALVPRPVRLLVYRSAGLDIRTLHVKSRCRFHGTGGVSVGEGTFINSECFFDAFESITVGQQCSIAMQVTIATSTHQVTASGDVDPDPVGQPVHIGDRCWLGARSTVLPGVRIGHGTIVAAGAVVTSDCEPDSVYAGVPARRVRGASERRPG